MTIKDCIDIVDNAKPNQYTIKEKVMWLSFIEAIIINEVLKTHEGYDGRYDMFEGYSEDKISQKLIVSAPYDRLYTQYLKMKIDEENGETTRYNNSAALYNNYMAEYKKYYNKTHLPLDMTNKAKDMMPKSVSVELSDAAYESIKKDLAYTLKNYFCDAVAPDKIADVVTKFVQNNMEMLKGKNGYTPVKGTDYFTDEEKDEIRTYIDKLLKEKINRIEKTLDEIKKADKPLVRTVTIDLIASNWVGSDNSYSQVVTIAGTTPYSKVDLQPSAEQLAIFHEKDITFVTENVGGVITVICIGIRPTNSYTMQATITEVTKDE